MSSVIRDEEAVSEPMEGMPLLPGGGRAQVSHDISRISVEELGDAGEPMRNGSSAGCPGLGDVAAPESNGTAAPGEGDLPRDWRSRGIFATVDPDNTEMILSLRDCVDTRLHEAARTQDLPALETRLAGGAEAASLDWEGRTPLHLCVALRLIEPLKVLLKDRDIVNVRDASDLTLLNAALLHGWRDGVRAILDAGARVSTGCEIGVKRVYSTMNRYPDIEESKFCSSFEKLPIEIAMETGDTEMFEMVLHATKCQGMLDELNGSLKTALISAIESSNFPAIKALLRSGASLDIVSEYNKTTALHAAVHDHNILEYLLDYPGVTDSMLETFDRFGDTPLHSAVFANNPESVKLLLDRCKDKRIQTERPAGATPLHCAVYNSSYEAAEVILDKDIGAMNVEDNRGDTPLMAAARWSSRRISELLLERGGLLSTKHKNGETVLNLICHNYYDIQNFFERLFDKYITSENKDDGFKLSVEYRVFTDEKGMSQINVLEEFVKYGQSKLLMHPLVESLLYLKWIQFLPLYYALLSVYTIFLVSVNIFVINVAYLGDISSTDTNHTFKIPGPEEFHAGATVYWLLIVLMYASISLLLLQDCFSIYVKRWRYFLSWESWVRLVGLVLSAATPPLAALARGPWARHAACAALLLAWLQATFLVSRLLSWGYYALMLGKVALNLFKILTTVIFLVIGFAICFMIQFQWAPPFEDPFAALVKTLVMLSSEFDYEDLFGNHEEQLKNTKNIVRLLFLTFLIFMAIVLMNFMTGVAVDNISDLSRVGNTKRLEKQVALLSCLDHLVYDGVFANWLKRIIGDRRFVASMHTYRWAPIWYVRKSSDNNDPEHQIQIKSSRLYNGIIESAGRHEERTEINKHNATEKLHRTKLDSLCNEIIDNAAVKDEKGKRGKQLKFDTVTLKQQVNILFNDRIKLTQVTKEIEELKRSIRDLSLQSKAMLTILEKK